EETAFQENDGGPVSLAADGSAGGLKDLVHRREDVRVVVPFREPELAAVVLFQSLDLDIRRAQGEAHDDDRREDVPLVVDALAQGSALAGEQDRTALGACDPHLLDRAVSPG